MGVRVASLLEIKNVLLVGMNLRLVEEADPLHLGIVLDIVLYTIIQRLTSIMMMTSQLHISANSLFFYPPTSSSISKLISKRDTYIFTVACIETDEIGVVAAEVSSINLKTLQKTGGAQLDLNPIVVSLHAGTAGLPAITGVHSRGRKNDIGRLSVTVIAGLDHPAAIGHRSKVKHCLFLGENGRHVTVNAKTGLCGYPMYSWLEKDLRGAKRQNYRQNIDNSTT